MTAYAARLLALGCVLLLAGCQTPKRAALPPVPGVVEVDMADNRFDYDPAIGSGRVLFRVTNTGTVPHSLSLLPLTDDIPPIDDQLHGTTRRTILPLAAIKARPPGTSTTFAVDLTPGVRYAMVCFVDDADGVPHALKGMNSEFRTTGAPEGQPTSTTASSVVG